MTVNRADIEQLLKSTKAGNPTDHGDNLKDKQRKAVEKYLRKCFSDAPPVVAAPTQQYLDSQGMDIVELVLDDLESYQEFGERLP